jgi:hypothetical protein
MKDKISAYIQSKIKKVKNALNPTHYGGFVNQNIVAPAAQVQKNIQDFTSGKRNLVSEVDVLSKEADRIKSKPLRAVTNLGLGQLRTGATLWQGGRESAIGGAKIGEGLSYVPQALKGGLDTSERKYALGQIGKGSLQAGTGLLQGLYANFRMSPFGQGTTLAENTAFESLNKLRTGKNPLDIDFSGSAKDMFISDAIGIRESHPTLSLALDTVTNLALGRFEDKLVKGFSKTKFNSPEEALRAVRAEVKSIFGNDFRTKKGSYTTKDKFIKGTRAYFKNNKDNNAIFGMMAGIEPYQDEDGKWRVKFDANKSMLGFALAGGVKAIQDNASQKAGKLGKGQKPQPISPEVPKIQPNLETALKPVETPSLPKIIPQDLKVRGQEKLKDLMTYNDRLVKEAGLTPEQANKLSVKQGMDILNQKNGSVGKTIPQEQVVLKTKPQAVLTSRQNQNAKISLPKQTEEYLGKTPQQVLSQSNKYTSESPKGNLTPIGKTIQEIQAITNKLSKESSSYDGIIPQKSPEFSEFEASLRTNRMSPKMKANALDVLRTPEKVLNKMGLEKEAKLIRKGWDKYKSDKNIELNKINEWYKQAPDKESSQAIFKYLDGQKVNLSDTQLKIANEIKTYLKDWADKLELPEDKRISSYITHIWEKGVEGTDIDPEFAKLIAEKVPGSVYDPFVTQRLGKQGYKEDVWAALDAYVKRATRKVNMDPALEKLKYASESLDLESYKYVKKYADALNMRPTELESLFDNAIKSVAGYRFTARPTAYLSSKWRKQIYRGALGLNIGSATRNLTQGVNTYAKLGEKYTILGYVDIAKRLGTKDGLEELKRVGVLDDSFVADRSVSAMKRGVEKLDKFLFTFFDLAEKINRGSAYYGAKKKAIAKGMSEVEAVDFAKQIVRDTQFTFGAIDTPQILRSDINKTLGQFQSFNLKQAEFLGEMIKSKDVAGLVRFSAGSVLMLATIGKLIGLDWKDNLPFSDFITGEQKIADTPALQALTGAHQMIFGDEYEKSKGKDKLAKTLVLLAPAGSQIKKTFQGLKAGQQGYSSTKSGGARFLVPENRKLQSAIFGQYSTPEAKEYFKEDRRPLSEKQTEVLKQSTDKKATYQEIMQTREKNAEETKVREKVKESGQMQETDDKWIYWDSDKGETASIKKNPDLTPPELTGKSALDKETLSDYQSKISSRINDIVKMYELKLISAEEAEAEIGRLQFLKKAVQNLNKSMTPKKAKAIKLSIPKVQGKSSRSAPKIAKLKTPDSVKFNVGNKLPATNFKVSKADLEKLRTGNV